MRKIVIIFLVILIAAALILDDWYKDNRPTVWPRHSELVLDSK